jgi:hypothetical protein
LRDRRRPAIWAPSTQETRLLRAGLWPGERGLAAWAQWRRSGSIDSLERGADRLLPLVYANLGPLLAGDPDAGRLKAIHRRSWASNQLALRVGQRSLQALRAAGVETLVLKGAALIELAYGDAGARPVGDIDVAVRPSQIETAVEALRGAGIQPTDPDPVRKLAIHHSRAFVDKGGQEVDLHARVLWLPVLNDELWEGAVAVELAGVPTTALCPTDQLLHVCVHGAAWNRRRPVRWAADACKVMAASSEEIDWERLEAMAVTGRLTAPLRECLSWMSDELDAPVDAGTLRALWTVRVSLAERRAHQTFARPMSWRRSFAMLWWFWERHRAQAALDGKGPSPRGFLRYMQSYWDLHSPRQVPLHAARRVLRWWGQGAAAFSLRARRRT